MEGVKSVIVTPFKTEKEFETTVFETSELLEDIFLLKRQVHGREMSERGHVITHFFLFKNLDLFTLVRGWPGGFTYSEKILNRIF